MLTHAPFGSTAQSSLDSSTFKQSEHVRGREQLSSAYQVHESPVLELVVLVTAEEEPEPTLGSTEAELLEEEPLEELMADGRSSSRGVQ
ncbi:hypothetical protein BBJ28_00008388 [Nothophytophthora sp. Chile5]|nr:hypothetical protein BBJ28_00008388 [Nothophytophthora sp. Chile5]